MTLVVILFMCFILVSCKEKTSTHTNSYVSLTITNIDTCEEP